jgi:Ca2+:H+ antiporter
MLLLAVVALVLPAMYLLARGGELPQLADEATNFPSTVEHMSFAVAIVLLCSYFAGLWFSLKTHRDVFNPDTEHEDVAAQAWSVKKSVGLLAGAGVAVGIMSEILVGSIEEASKGIGLSPFFVSLIIVAIVGNAAEHWVAVYFAARNKMDIAISIAIGSSAQIALFVMPVLVLTSFVLGPFPLAMEFSSIEIGAVLLAVLIASHVSQDGESTWFEGVQLLAVYVVLGIVFYFV